MAYSTPRRFALILALWVSVTVAVVVTITSFVAAGEAIWWVPVASLTTTFILTYFIAAFAVERFIYDKIKVIYKLIHSQKVKKEDKTKPTVDLDRDIIGEVNNEVAEWANERDKEIEYLRNLENYRKEFVGNVSHELKTPIFNIQGYVLTLLDGGLEDPTINRNYLQRAEASIERMINIVQDLESISQFESGQLILDIERTDIVRVANEVISALELKAKKKVLSWCLKKNTILFM
ncbi:MAG: cell wall metabolism sensor histidine kinase WalK [Sphingobacteriales bacterium JAD_PAG50586_3]|nr:MAG: cell wall metabolism sensor histidine kinase WalK [Sphingobacteriales bacterium JAD_PAG50586_3]